MYTLFGNCYRYSLTITRLSFRYPNWRVQGFAFLPSVKLAGRAVGYVRRKQPYTKCTFPLLIRNNDIQPT